MSVAAARAQEFVHAELRDRHALLSRAAATYGAITGEFPEGAYLYNKKEYIKYTVHCLTRSSPMQVDNLYFAKLNQIYLALINQIKHKIEESLPAYRTAVAYRGAVAYARNQKSPDQICAAVTYEIKLLKQLVVFQHDHKVSSDDWSSCSAAYEVCVNKLSDLSRTMNVAIEDIGKIKRETVRVKMGYVALVVALTGILMQFIYNIYK